jgi:hypothetical protein
MWTALSFVNFVGPLAHFGFGRRRQRPGQPLVAHRGSRARSAMLSGALPAAGLAVAGA